MSTSVVLPALGESVTEGTVTRWLKKVGDTVQADEGLLEISTDKVDTEIPSPVSRRDRGDPRPGGRDGRGRRGSREDRRRLVGARRDRLHRPRAEPAAEPAPAAAEAPLPRRLPRPPRRRARRARPLPPRPRPLRQLRTAAASGGKEVLLPELGESVTEGTITRWLKQVGDQVETDEPLLEISTDKVDTEIPSPVQRRAPGDPGQGGRDGCRRHRARPCRRRRCGRARAAPRLPRPLRPAGPGSRSRGRGSRARSRGCPAAGGARSSAPPLRLPQPAPAPAPRQPRRPPRRRARGSRGPAAAGVRRGGRPTYVTPLVRRLAQQQGVDLGSVTGTGVGGRIRKEDVLKAAEASAAPAAPEAPAAPPRRLPLEVSPLRGTTQPMSRLRKVLAERAVASMQATAQLTTVIEVDVTKLANFRDKVKNDFLAKTGDKLSFLPFFALAAAEALQAYPVVNSTVDDGQIVYPPTENLSIAVDTERGLLTPVLRDAGSKNLAQIAHEIADLAGRTRNNKLKPDELAGGTFTLTNTGSRGALFDTPVVFLPQSAILGTGVVVKRPGVVTVDGKDAISVRSYVYLALSYDHRIIDGADAARFLGAVKARLEAAQFEGNLGI